MVHLQYCYHRLFVSMSSSLVTRWELAVSIHQQYDGLDLCSFCCSVATTVVDQIMYFFALRLVHPDELKKKTVKETYEALWNDSTDLKFYRKLKAWTKE